MLRFECIGDVFQENQTEDDVLVLRRVHVVAKSISRAQSFDSKPSGVPVANLVTFQMVCSQSIGKLLGFSDPLKAESSEGLSLKLFSR